MSSPIVRTQQQQATPGALLVDDFVIRGPNPNTQLLGTANADTLIGQGGNESISGLGGNDVLNGGAGNDTLLGGDGNDTLDGGTGSDHYYGGAGADHFVVKIDPNTTDVIYDFKVNGGADKIDLRAFNLHYDEIKDAMVTVETVDQFGQVSRDVHIRFPNGNGQAMNAAIEGGQTLIIKNKQISELTKDDFLTSVQTPVGDGIVHGTSDSDNIGLGYRDAQGDRVTTGNDTILSGDGNDTVNGAAGNDSINGNAGNDLLVGGEGNDSVSGGDGNDDVYAGNGNDSLSGGNGNDVLNGGVGADTIDGGTGNDMVNYNTATTRVIVNLQTNRGSQGEAEGDTYTSIEGVVGGSANDEIIGNDEDNTILGGNGNDSMVSGGGQDLINGGEGNDTLDGGAGVDNYWGGAGADRFLVQAQPNTTDVIWDLNNSFGDTGDKLDMTPLFDLNYTQLRALMTQQGSDVVISLPNNQQIILRNKTIDGNITPASNTISWVTENDFITSTRDGTVNGTGGNDLIGLNFRDAQGDSVTAGNDKIDGGQGNDTLRSGAGDDVLIGGIGGDELDGGAGSDTADYSGSQRGVRVTLQEGNERLVFGDFWGDAQGDVLKSVENLIGSSGDDGLFGNASSNRLEGGAGNDVIIGVSNSNAQDFDILSGGTGNDTLRGGFGAESIYGGAGNDSIDSGNNLPNTAQIQSEIFGDAGDDTIVAKENTSVVDGGSGNDVITSYGGSGAGTWVIGGEGNDKITAFHGQVANKNYIEAGAGNDTIELRGGDQVVSGGAGADLFIINPAINFLQNAASYVIRDFKPDQGDVLDLRGFGKTNQELFDGASESYSPVYGKNVVQITLSNNQIITLVDVTKDKLLLPDKVIGREVPVVNTITGTEGNNLLIGRDDIGDIINANGGNDDIYANGGNDSVSGGAGDDVLNGGAGADTLDGGTGSDYANYNSANMFNVNQTSQFVVNGIHFSGIKINMFEAQGQQVSADILANIGVQQHQVSATGDAAGDRYTSIENIVGSQHGDLIIGDNQSNVVWARGGHDSVFGNGGDDILVGEDGYDTLDGGSGSDQYYGGALGDVFRIKLEANVTEIIHDFKTDEQGEKIDLRSLPSSFEGLMRMADPISGPHVTFNLPNNQKLILYNVNQFAGGRWVTKLTADDFILGGSDRVVSGTEGNDVINFSFRDADGDAVTHGADIVNAGAGDDTVVGGQGADRLDGGEGQADFIEYFGSQAVNVTLNGAASGGDAQGDTLSGFERLGGTSNNDTLTGDQNNNTIWGRDGGDLINTGGGHDHLHGEGGNDTLDGGGGHDIYYGGAGADLFKVGAQEAGAADHIMDFEQTVAGEKIEISGMNNIPNFAALQTRMFQEDGRVRIDLENNQKLYIYNKQINQLSADDFQFVRGVSTDNIVRGTAGDDIINMPIPAANIRGYVDPDGKSVSQSADVVEAGTGNDRVLSMGGNDIVKGQEGNDSLFGGEGDDYLDGGTGDDSLSGQEGDDYLMGGGGKDILFGGAGNDTLDGSGGYDILFAGAGNDVVIMGKAQSYAGVYGEAGNDTFTFNFQNLFNNQGSSVSFINDFTRGQDKIKLEGVSQQDYHGGIVNVEAQYRGNEQTNQQELVGYNITHDYYGGVTLQIRVDGQNSSSLTINDFLF